MIPSFLHLKYLLLTFTSQPTALPLFDDHCYTDNTYSPIVISTLCIETDTLPTSVPTSSSPAVCYASPTSPVPAASPALPCIGTIYSIITVTQEPTLPATTLLTTTLAMTHESLATASLSESPQAAATTSLSTEELSQAPKNEPPTITISFPAKSSPSESSAAVTSSAPTSGEKCTWTGHCKGKSSHLLSRPPPLPILFNPIRTRLTMESFQKQNRRYMQDLRRLQRWIRLRWRYMRAPWPEILLRMGRSLWRYVSLFCSCQKEIPPLRPLFSSASPFSTQSANPQHRVGATCKTLNDCSDSLVCHQGKCGPVSWNDTLVFDPGKAGRGELGWLRRDFR